MNTIRYRVVIPRRDALAIIRLSRKINAKHIADGQSSKLTGFNMVDMQSKTDYAYNMHTEAKQLERDAEAAIEDRNLALGFAKNQESTTSGTVLYYVCSVRDFLTGTFKGNLRKLGSWGFTVNDSTDENFRVIIPETTEPLISLAMRIVAKHNADGTNSILKGFNMTGFEAKTVLANEKHELAINLKNLASELIQERNSTLGFAKNQQSTTQGTVLYYITAIRDVLLGYFRGKERKLSAYGFKIVGSTSGNNEIPSEIVAVTDQSTKQTVEVGIGTETDEQFTQEWGDGTNDNVEVSANTNTFVSKEYAETGTYTMKTKGKVEKIKEYHSNNSRLTSFIWPLIATKIMLLVLQNNLLPTEVVNLILITIDSFGTSGGVINLIGNAAPTGAGLIAKANLQARGWMVLTS